MRLLHFPERCVSNDEMQQVCLEDTGVCVQMRETPTESELTGMICCMTSAAWQRNEPPAEDTHWSVKEKSKCWQKQLNFSSLTLGVTILAPQQSQQSIFQTQINCWSGRWAAPSNTKHLSGKAGSVRWDILGSTWYRLYFVKLTMTWGIQNRCGRHNWSALRWQQLQFNLHHLQEMWQQLQQCVLCSCQYTE